MPKGQTGKSSKQQSGLLLSGQAQQPAANTQPPTDHDDNGPTSFRLWGGSTSKALNNVLANQAIRMVWLPPGIEKDSRTELLRAAVAVLSEFKPKDGVEGMMAVQALGLHSASVECLRRAMIPDQPFETADRLRRQGANLSRAFLEVVAALDRKRGKSVHQVVRIERVQIAPGGHAAIVGNMTAAAGQPPGASGVGVGHDGQTRGEPHASAAQLAHDAPVGPVLCPVRSEDAGRDTVPVACDEQRPLPHARRRQHGP